MTSSNRAKEIIQTVIYAAIATVSKDSKPWNTPVRYIYDTELNIYWFSDKENQHSRNVRDNTEAYLL